MKIANWRDLRPHPLAERFPLIRKHAFEELCRDMAVSGLQQPILIADGMVADGRNRLRACIATNTDPDFIEYDPSMGPLWRVVLSLNLARRHLTATQRAAIATDFLEEFEAEAAKRYAATVGRPSSGEEKSPEIFPAISGKRDARDDAAAVAEVNPRYVSDAKRIRETAPEVFRALSEGRLEGAPETAAPLTMPEAKALASVPAEDRPAVIAAAKEIGPKKAVTDYKRQKTIEKVAAQPKDRRARVIHGRMQEVPLPVDAFDLIVTDPPYGVAGTNIARSQQSDLIRDYGAWDYGDLPIGEWAPVIARSLRSGGSLYLFTGDDYYPSWRMELERAGLTWIQLLVWSKANPAPQVRQSRWCNSQEFILFMCKGDRPSVFHFLGQREMLSVLHGPIAQGEERTDHPTQKPLWLIDRLIEVSSEPGQTFLDPFAGSGSHGVAALARGLDVTIIEADDGFVQLCEARCA